MQGELLFEFLGKSTFEKSVFYAIIQTPMQKGILKYVL